MHFYENKFQNILWYQYKVNIYFLSELLLASVISFCNQNTDVVSVPVAMTETANICRSKNFVSQVVWLLYPFPVSRMEKLRIGTCSSENGDPQYKIRPFSLHICMNTAG